MKAVVQVVTQAQVKVNDSITGGIDKGLLVFIGVHRDDEQNAITKMAHKLVNLRIFEDEEGKLKRSVQDVGGSILVVSQFTLYGDCNKGTKPSFSEAAPPDKAEDYYLRLADALKERGVAVETGQFRSFMEVNLTNNGPITLIIDT